MTTPGTSGRVYELLDEIRNDLGKVKTDVAVLAAGQPRVLDIIQDHETRIRDLVMMKADKADQAAIESRVTTIETIMNRNAWMGRVGIGGASAAVAAVITWGITTWLGH